MTAFKKFVLIPVLAVGALLVLTVAGLYLYLSDARLRGLIEPALESALDRDVTLESVRLSLFRTFPNIGFGVEGLKIHTPDGPDLASIDALWVAAPLSSVMGDALRVSAIELIGPRILIEPIGEGRTTLDGLGGETSDAPADSTPAGTIQLDRISVRDGAFAYADEAGTLFAIADLDADLRANLAETMALSGYIEAFGLTYESAGITYASDWDLRLDVDADADLTAETLRLGATRLRAENLDIAMAGEIAGWSRDRMHVDLTIDSPDGSIEGFLSLLPKGLVRDLGGLVARGAFSLAATIKGEYGEDVMPAIDARIGIQDGFIQYPGLPEAITGLALDAHITDTQIDIARLTAAAAGNTLSATGRIVNGPTTTVDATFAMNADLATIPRFYPLDPGTTLAGAVQADARIQGPVDNPQALEAEGMAELKGVRYASPDLPQPLDVLDGVIRLDRDVIRLERFALQAGQTDATLDGAVTNYMSFASSAPDAPAPAFTGQMHSNLLFADELIPEDTTDTEPLDLPDLLMDVTYTANRLVYSGIELAGARTVIHLEDDILTMSDMSAAMFDGQLTGRMSFSTQDPLNPTTDGAIALKGLEAERFFASMETVNRFARLGGFFEGLFDSEARFALRLDSLLNPQLESVQASGLFGAREGSLTGLPILEKLSAFTGLADLRSLALNDWSQSFSVAGERLDIRDLNLNAGPYTLQLNGSQGLDDQLDYTLRLVLPASASDALLAAPVGAALRPLAGIANAALADPTTGRIVLDLLAQGEFGDPAIRLNTDMMKTRLESHASALVAGARQEAEARLDSLARAQKAALEQEARSRLENLVGADSSALATPNIDSLKTKGEDLVKDRLKGLLNRKKNN